MHNLTLVPEYIAWHYTRGVIEIFHFDKRLFSVTRKSFSFSLILKTFLSPWKRMGEEYKKSDPGSWATTFIFNILMRALGMCIRTAILVLGGFACFFAALVGCLAFIVWLSLPLIIVGFFMIGLRDLCI